MVKEYKYVGPHEILLSVADCPTGIQIDSVNKLLEWLDRTGQKPDPLGLIVTTFVVGTDGYLCIADRHSEHIACAGGKPVLSAGEMFLARGNKRLEVVEISNQSTGFCPEPESWPSVAKALDRIPLTRPDRFTVEFVFRRCPACGQLNIVKEEFFSCAVCGSDLPIAWNCDRFELEQE